ncbi:hypothetical protein VTI74DRAFT_1230 [Chaetomium olivicolor]
MPPLTLEEVRLREELCMEYRIVFAGETRPSEWPERHRRTLQQVRELGNRKYDTYADSPERGDYEPCWRHGCEPIILGRLSVRSVAGLAGGRIWRSDIESDNLAVAQDKAALRTTSKPSA